MSNSNYLLKKSEVLNILSSEGCAFLTGGAGSGKSYMLRDIAKDFRHTIMLAPTGLSAVNIGGQTIHKFLGIRTSLFSPVEVARNIKNNKSFNNIIHNTDLIIIDEVSMCTPIILDALDEVLRTITGKPCVFGGKKVLFCGDLAQLPPVVREEEAKILMQEFGYKDMSPTSSNVFKDVTMIELEGTYRQRDDIEYYEVLRDLRNAIMGNGIFKDVEKSVRLLNQQCMGNRYRSDMTVLVYTNKEAKKINDMWMSSGKGDLVTYPSKIIGSWKDGNSRAMENLSIKPGARVTCIANIGGVVNGDTGIVLSLGVDNISIRVDRTSEIESINPYTWESYDYSYDPNFGIIKKITGTMTQFPLLLSYAHTVHSSQGSTLKGVFIPNPDRMNAALIYVALSRATKIDDVGLSYPLSEYKFSFKFIQR